MTNGKGDRRRPTSVPDDILTENWERTFGKRTTPCPNCGSRNTAPVGRVRGQLMRACDDCQHTWK